MPKYNVTVTRIGSVIVDAEDEQAAMELADELTSDEIQWDEYKPTDAQEIEED